jgi:hypothetical protein
LVQSARLSLAAVVVSVIVAWRQTDIQARVAAIEKARRAEEAEARRRARVTAGFDVSFRVLCLTNDGPAAARGVSVEVRPIGDGQPPALDLRRARGDLRPEYAILVRPAAMPNGSRFGGTSQFSSLDSCGGSSSLGAELCLAVGPDVYDDRSEPLRKASC